jgi:hypothetical protein
MNRCMIHEGRDEKSLRRRWCALAPAIFRLAATSIGVGNRGHPSCLFASTIVEASERDQGVSQKSLGVSQNPSLSPQTSQRPPTIPPR